MDKTFRKIIILVAILATIWGCIPADAKSDYKVNGKVDNREYHHSSQSPENILKQSHNYSLLISNILSSLLGLQIE